MNQVRELTIEQQFIQAAQQFLTRCDLKGGEVDAYAKAFNFLQNIVDGETLVIPTKVWNEVNEQVKELQAKISEFEAIPEEIEEEETPPPSDRLGWG